MRLICSKCGKILVDTKTKECNCTIMWFGEIKNELEGYVNIELSEEYLICTNCGHEIDLYLIKKKVPKEVFDKIIEIVRESGEKK